MSYWQSLHNLLEEYGRNRHPKSYLEIGVRDGGSLFALLNVWAPERVVLCDDWGTAAGGTGRGSHAHIDEAMRAFKTPEYLDGNSHVLLKTVTETFEFITVDGDHSKEGATQDLEDAWPLLEMNGLLFFDDIYHPMHLYLMDALNEFVQRHPDALLIRIQHTNRAEPGCAVIEKVG